MPKCVNDLCSGPYVLFKGRWLCPACFERVKENLGKILNEKENRERRILLDNEEIRINAPRIVVDEFRRACRIRGTHLTITRRELERIDKKEENKAQ